MPSRPSPLPLPSPAAALPAALQPAGEPQRHAALSWSTALADGLVLLVAAVCLFWGLGAAPIRDTNEALYADIALTMAHGGSWIIPHLDGVPYIEKPPLLYWLMAWCFKLFGVGAWQARLPDALAAWLTALGCIAFGRLMRAPLAGRFAALVVGTALGYVLIARTILFDPLLVLFWLTALACTVVAVQRQQRAWLRLAAVAVALATLTKGPMALLLLGLVVVVQLLLAPGRHQRGALLRFYLDPWAIGLFVLIVAPWHVAALQTLPGFGWFFFVNETIGRFLGTRIPDDFHHGPWWYYGPKLLIGEHGETVSHQGLRRGHGVPRVGLQGVVVADDFELDPVRAKNLPRHLRQRHRLAGRVAACGVGQEVPAQRLDALPPRLSGLGFRRQPAQRHGQHLRLRRLHGIGQNARRGIARGAEKQAAAQPRAGHMQRIGLRRVRRLRQSRRIVELHVILQRPG